MADDGEQTPSTSAEVVFCGGCNPHIDRTAVADELRLDDPDVPEGASVVLNGCPRACASAHRLTLPGAHAGEAGDDAPTVVVAGELVDGVPTPAAEIVATVTHKLKE
jgi:hypothetical protein